MIYPAVHYIAYDENEDETISMIKTELKNRVIELESENKILESQRLQQRVKYDIEMIREMGLSRNLIFRQRYLPVSTVFRF